MAIARVRAKNIGAIRHNTDCQGHLTDRDGFAQGPGRGIEAGGMRKWIRTELQWGSGRSGVGDPGEVALGSGQSGVGARTAWHWAQDGVALGPNGVALGPVGVALMRVRPAWWRALLLRAEGAARTAASR